MQQLCWHVRPDAAKLDQADKEAYVADVLTDQCIDFIAETKDKPFLAVLSHCLVHSPIEPKPEKLARYKNKPATPFICTFSNGPNPERLR